MFYYVLVYLFSLGFIWLYVLSPVSLFSSCMFRFLPCLCLLNMLFMLLCLHRESLSSVFRSPLPFMSHDVFISLFVPFSCSLPLCLVSSSCLHLSLFHFMSPLSVMCSPPACHAPCMCSIVKSVSHLSFPCSHIPSMSLSLCVSCFTLKVSRPMFSMSNLLPPVLSLCQVAPAVLRMCFLFLCHPHVYSGSLCHSFSVRLSVEFMPCFQVSMFQVSTHPHQISCLGCFMSIFGFPILGYYLASSWFAFPHCFVVC